MTGDIDPVCFHGFDGTGIDTMRFYARTEHFNLFTSEMTEISFCDLAAATIARTEY